jgi:hypothetical protein
MSCTNNKDSPNPQKDRDLLLGSNGILNYEHIVALCTHLPIVRVRLEACLNITLSVVSTNVIHC